MQPPRVRQHACRRARAPPARLVAHRDAPHRDAEHPRIVPARGLEIALRLALEKIAHPPRKVRAVPGDAQQRHSFGGFGPHRAARGAMHDSMRHIAQRQLDSLRERHRLRQALQPRRDPAAVAFREGLGLAQRSAQRHGEHDRAGCRLHAQRIAPRPTVPAQLDRIDRAVECDLDRLRLDGAAEQKRAQRHRRIPDKSRSETVSPVA